MPNTKQTHYHGDDEIIERNVERSRELIEARKRGADEEQLDRLEVAEPEDTRDFAPPGQSNVPVGGTTGPNARGGSAKRQKTG